MRPINFRTLDLNLLRVFDAVMVERHVTRAADRLAMTQPAVSNALKRLKEATHAELFVAMPHGMMPTPQAQELWPVVRDVLARLQAALAPQSFDARVDRRVFSVAMADATAAHFLPPLTRQLQQDHALVDVRVVALDTRDPRPMLERGDADVAVGFFPDVAAALRAEADTALTRLEPLYGCKYVCVMRQGHPLAAPGALTLDAYCAAQHLRVNFASRPHGYVDDALTRLGRTRRVMLTVPQFATASGVVAQTDLLTVLPQSYLQAMRMATALEARPLPFDMPGIEVSLLWHRRHEHDAGQRWLRATLVQTAQAAQRASNLLTPNLVHSQA